MCGMGDINHRSITPRRLHLGLTQEQLAERTGIRRQTLIAIERGQSTPSVDVALDLARELQCSVEQLFVPIPLETMLGAYYRPSLLDQPVHRAIEKAKTPFLVASRASGGSSTLLDSIIAQLGVVAIVPSPGIATCYRPPNCTIVEVVPDTESGFVKASKPETLRGARALIVPELTDAERTMFATKLAITAKLPIYSTLHVSDPQYIGERLRILTGGDEEASRYWSRTGALWVDRQAKSISVEKLLLIEPVSYDFIQDRFAEWCSLVHNRVCRDEVALQYAWSGHTWPGQTKSTRDLGNFSNEGRFVHMSAMRDGRILVSGLEAVIKPVMPGEEIPRGNQLFPGGLATMVSMDDTGAELAASAIEAWLLFRDDALPQIRRDFSRHVASALTLIE